MTLKSLWGMTKQTFAEFSDDNVPRLSASLAYYSVLSLAPMLVLAVIVLAAVYGQEAAQGKIAEELHDVVGPRAAGAINDILAHAGEQTGSGIVATIISVGLLLFGASVVFGELQSSLNTVFDVRPRPDAGWMVMVRKRLLSMGLVFGIAFLLLVSLVASTIISAMADRLSGGSQAVAQVLDIAVGTAIVALLFGALFKILPDVDLAWKDVAIGATLTAVMFTIGRYLLSYYLSTSSTTSAYGAAGSLAALLIWIYYTSMILFIGAEFTQIYSNRYGTRVRPEHEDVVPQMGEDPSAKHHPSRAGDPMTTGRRAASANDPIAKERELTGERRKGKRPAAHALGRTDWGPRAVPMTAAQTQARMKQQLMLEQMREAQKTVPALTFGTVVGSAAALIGVYLKHKLTETHLKADEVDQRLQRIEQRVGSLDRLERMNREANVRAHLRDIESRILTAARASRKAEILPLRQRLRAMLRDFSSTP